jgi:hypothetical protein
MKQFQPRHRLLVQSLMQLVQLYLPRRLHLRQYHFLNRHHFLDMEMQMQYLLQKNYFLFRRQNRRYFPVQDP